MVGLGGWMVVAGVGGWVWLAWPVVGLAVVAGGGRLACGEAWGVSSLVARRWEFPRWWRGVGSVVMVAG